MFDPGQRYGRVLLRRAFPAADAGSATALGADGFALFVQLGSSPDRPSFPERSELHWPGDLPQRAVERGARVLVFLDDGAPALECLGEAIAASYAHGNAGAVHDARFSLQQPLSRARWLELIGPWLPDAAVHPEAELVRLTRLSSPTQRWAALGAFVERWYQRPIAGVDRDVEPGAAPLLLRKLGALHAALPEIFKFNHPVALAKLAQREGKLEFLFENQGVCLWATEPAGDDPRVWYRSNEEGAAWLEEEARLSEFLVQALLFEAISHARFGASATHVDEDTLAALLAQVDPLSRAPWHWCGVRLYARDGALLMTMGDEEQTDVLLAAHSPLLLSRFESLVGNDWDRVSF